MDGGVKAGAWNPPAVTPPPALTPLADMVASCGWGGAKFLKGFPWSLVYLSNTDMPAKTLPSSAIIRSNALPLTSAFPLGALAAAMDAACAAASASCASRSRCMLATRAASAASASAIALILSVWDLAAFSAAACARAAVAMERRSSRKKAFALWS